MRTPEFLPIDFLIIGGSICGLSSAIALARTGHRVTVVDCRDPLVADIIDSGCRLPPNSTKVYYRWGMEQRLHANSVKQRGTLFASFESGSVMGAVEWEEDVLEETGGDFLLMSHGDIRRVLGESALEHGVKLRCGPGCLVVKINPDESRPSAELENGESLSADVIVCADGFMTPEVFTRKHMADDFGMDGGVVKSDVLMFNWHVPEADLHMIKDLELLERLRTEGQVFYWNGTDRCALGWPVKKPVTGEPIFSMHCSVPAHDEEGQPIVHSATKEQVLELLEGADSRLRELAELAQEVFVMEMDTQPPLEEWVHPCGRIICLGEAAHPTPMGSIYAFAMSAGDAAVLGRVFSHLHREDQISYFLTNVQEIRKPRVERIGSVFKGNVFAVVLPPELAAERDRKLTERAEKGLQKLARGPSHSQPSSVMMQVIETVFGYDPEDEADDWWFEWGRMQERSARTPSPSTASETSTMSGGSDRMGMGSGVLDMTAAFAAMQTGMVTEKVTMSFGEVVESVTIQQEVVTEPLPP